MARLGENGASATFPSLQRWRTPHRRALCRDGPLYVALEAARCAETPTCASQYEGNTQLVLLVKLCRELQRLSNGKPFFLDCRKAGELIGIDHVKAWRYLRGLTQETPPILKIVSTGSRAAGKAKERKMIKATDILTGTMMAHPILALNGDLHGIGAHWLRIRTFAHLYMSHAAWHETSVAR